MAKKNKARPRKSKTLAKNAPKAAGRSGKAETGKSAKPSRELPKPQVTATQARGFEAQVRSLIRQMQLVVRQQQAIDLRLEQDRQERQQQAATAALPPPPDPAFAALPEFMAEMRERVGGIESRLQQPPRDPSLDVPLSVVQRRVMFAGACKTLGITQPTPAIIGRVMHDNTIFAPNDDKAPRRLLQLIYAKRNIPDHLSPEIRSVLERYENRVNESNSESTTAASTSGSQQSDKSTGRASSRVAKVIGREFDDRFDLIVNTGCGRKDPVQSGDRRNYRRYLTASGRELFNRWPDWSDATGGTGLVDEQAESPTSQPDRTGPDDGATQPAT